MNIYLKLVLSILLLSNNCFAQDQQLSEAWENLKTQLQRRNDVVLKLRGTLAESNLVDLNYLKQAESFSQELNRHTDTLFLFDSTAIAFAYQLYSDATQALSRTLVTLERDQEFRTSDPVKSKMGQLMGVENRLNLTKREYNQACQQLNRLDLLFGRPVQDELPKVKESKTDSIKIIDSQVSEISNKKIRKNNSGSGHLLP